MLVIENDAVTALVVSDGAGGIVGGARAAQLVIESFACAMADAFAAPPNHSHGRSRTERSTCSSFHDEEEDHRRRADGEAER